MGFCDGFAIRNQKNIALIEFPALQHCVMKMCRKGSSDVNKSDAIIHGNYGSTLWNGCLLNELESEILYAMRIVVQDTVEFSPGVFIQRFKLNYFVIKYSGVIKFFQGYTYLPENEKGLCIHWIFLQ